MRRIGCARIRIRLFAALSLIPLAGSLLLPVRTGAESGPVAEEAFWDLLAETRALVSTLPWMPEDKACRLARREAGMWKDVRAVRLSSGEVIPIRADWLVAGLDRCPPDSVRLLLRMDELLYAHAEAERDGPPLLGGIDVDALEKILSSSGFRNAAEGAEEGISLQELIDFLLRRLQELAEQLGHPQGLVWGIGLFAVLVLAGILSLSAGLLRRNLVPSAAVEPSGDRADEALTSDRAAGLAEERFAAGHKRQAIRYLYLSALLFLEERGHLSVNRSQTNQEYLRSVEHLPRLADPLRRAVAMFDRVWYGFQTPNEEECRALRQAVSEIRRRS
ncbi:MAG: DUF4129 domain-containing protein [Anaerolineales bacterium]|nr:DUF4129 domain-containing protein [Anaerolineales bacterium]